MTPYKIKKACYLLRSFLVGARRMLLFMVEQVFLLIGEFNVDTQCTVKGRKEVKEQRKFFMFKFSLS